MCYGLLYLGLIVRDYAPDVWFKHAYELGCKGAKLIFSVLCVIFFFRTLRGLALLRGFIHSGQDIVLRDALAYSTLVG